jgi:hypothetical protein
MSEPSNHIKDFLSSQEAAMKDFVTGFCKDLGVEELKAELSLHHERLEAFIDSIHEPLPASVTSQATPIAFATPIRGKAPTHTSSGKALRIAGAGTLFRSGSDKKRPPPPDHDDVDTDVSFDNILVEEGSPAPRKKRTKSNASELTNEESTRPNVHEAGTSGNNAHGHHQGSARRTASGRKAVFNNPFISR